jgi:hypothetical protein
VTTVVVLALVSGAGGSAAQTIDTSPPSTAATDRHAVHATPGAQDHPHAAPAWLCDTCPAARESSGTSWQPEASTVHGLAWTANAWHFTLHGEAAVVATNEAGPRGDEGTFSTNHVMLNGRRLAGKGVVSVRSMWTFEPAMGRRGYPLLFQTGETADGVNGLVDRQHPHDLPMELAVTYSHPVGSSYGFVYAAAVGEPALGPPAYMHRASASLLPIAPMSHHWLDSTHVTFGVITGGFVAQRRVKIEGSIFRGREPDQDRWGFEKPRFDSYSLRVSVNPAPALALQASVGVLEEPEQIHPGVDASRLTASLLYTGRLLGAQFDSTLAWGRNGHSRSVSTLPGTPHAHIVPGQITHALLGEASLRFPGRHGIVFRIERARKDELFDLTDPRHTDLFPVFRFTTGYSFDGVHLPGVRIGLGAALSAGHVPGEIREDYDGPGVSGLTFLRINLEGH